MINLLMLLFSSLASAGVAHLAIQDIFEAVHGLENQGLVAKVFLSFYQIYLDNIYDLLVPPSSASSSNPPALNIRQDPTHGVYVEHLSSIFIKDPEAANKLIKQGLSNRSTQSTQYNFSSSRSHAILQFYLDFEEPNVQNTQSTFNVSVQRYTVRRRKLMLVDLAGSEKMPTYKHMSKLQHREAQEINKSISALTNVILALNSDQHVPYRDNKLTRILGESLGGQAKSSLIACIVPCIYTLEETRNTLKFACQAKNIRKLIRKPIPEEIVIHTQLPIWGETGASIGGRGEGGIGNITYDDLSMSFATAGQSRSNTPNKLRRSHSGMEYEEQKEEEESKGGAMGMGTSRGGFRGLGVGLDTLAQTPQLTVSSPPHAMFSSTYPPQSSTPLNSHVPPFPPPLPSSPYPNPYPQSHAFTYPTSQTHISPSSSSPQTFISPYKALSFPEDRGERFTLQDFLKAVTLVNKAYPTPPPASPPRPPTQAPYPASPLSPVGNFSTPFNIRDPEDSFASSVRVRDMGGGLYERGIQTLSAPASPARPPPTSLNDFVPFSANVQHKDMSVQADMGLGVGMGIDKEVVKGFDQLVEEIKNEELEKISRLDPMELASQMWALQMQVSI